MKKNYFLTSLIILIFSATNIYSQCNVVAPADLTINCGSAASLNATTTAVTYTLVSTACSPISIIGTNAFPTSCDDCVTGQIPIGFSYNFLGNIYNTAVIQSNGILGFGPFTFTGYSSFAIPALGNPNNYIAGFFADIDIRYGGTITYQTVGVAPNRKFVVSYNNVVPYNLGSGAGTGTASFQIVLNENGPFQIIISQLSANWNASTSGALATSGAENTTGTFAVPVPGRNSTDWPGITTANQDCTTFNPVPCIFQRWQQGATIISTNPNITVSPTSTTTYVGYWNCGAVSCTDDTVVNVAAPSISLGTVSNNSDCLVPNGTFTINFNNFNPGNYNLNYLLNGISQTQNITIGTSFTFSSIATGVYSNFSVSSGTCGIASLNTTITITSPSLPITTGTSICVGGSGTISSSSCNAVTTSINQGTTFNTGTLATSDPTWTRDNGGTTCSAIAIGTYYYDIFPFTVSITGTYNLNMCTPGTDWDSHASLYQNIFSSTNPCGIPSNFVIANDDGNTGGNCENDSSLTTTLTAGTTYYLVSTSYSAGVTGDYIWSFTSGPVGSTLNYSSSTNTVQWYTSATGGTSISSSNPFNPVGVAGSGLINTNTSGIYTYYAACSAYPSCRTPVNYVINSVPTGNISGTGSLCNGSSTINVALTGSSPWTITYTDGITPITVSGITTSPYTFAVSPSINTTYTLTSVSNSTCAAVASGITGTAIISGKIWLGSTSNWNLASNWSTGILPTSTDCVVIPITLNNPIISGTNYNALAGTLIVKNNASLTVTPGNNITVTDWVNVETTGTFQIENNASLVQVNNVANIGNIIYKRNANIRKLDYVYWSSPVANFNVSTIANPIISGPIYKWNTTIANPNGGQGNWENATGNTMINAKGYIVRGPSSFSTTAASTLFGSFTGNPNNGTITFPIQRGSDTNSSFHTGINGTEINNYSDNWNLTGNPYPSSISASQFLFNNNTKIEGNIRLWTHGTLPAAIPSPFYASFSYNYNPSDYLTYNFTGTTCCPAAASDLFIGAAQGFFVLMKDGTTASDIVTFNNSLRSPNYANNYFFKNASQSNSETPSELVDIERHRFWLDVIDSNSQSDRILIGYVEGATNERDSFFDSNTFYTGSMLLYSTFENEKFNIQGRSLPFLDTDEVPLGLYIPTEGNYSIAIASVDGLFENQNIYIKDNLLNTISDLKYTPFTFFGTQGYLNNRFSIVYQNTALANTNFNYNNTIKVISKENLAVKSSGALLDTVIVYNILGKKLAEYNNINSNVLQLNNLQKNSATLLLKIKLQNGFIKNEMVLY